MRFFFTTVLLFLAAVSTIHAYPVHHQPRAFKHNDLEARAAIGTLLYNRDLGLIDVYARIGDASEYYRARGLPLRDDIESELVRRSAKGKAGTPAKGKGKAPAAPHKSSVKVGAKTQPKKMPVAWRTKAAHDASQPLAGTWQHGQHATVMHEAIVRNHGKHNVPGAKSAQIFRGAHPGGHDPAERDHITVKYFDKKGKKIHDGNGNDLHHVYTGRESWLDMNTLQPHPPAHP